MDFDARFNELKEKRKQITNDYNFIINIGKERNIVFYFNENLVVGIHEGEEVYFSRFKIENNICYIEHWDMESKDYTYQEPRRAKKNESNEIHNNLVKAYNTWLGEK